MSLDAIGIACKDLEKSIKFYNLLGLEFKDYGKGHFEATTKSGLRVMLDSFELMKNINPNWQEPQAPGITLCFVTESVPEVDQTYKALVEAGHRGIKEPWDAFWGQRYSSVLDPDGNQVDIFAAL